jgi:heterodisulfide reductase subunit D
MPLPSPKEPFVPRLVVFACNWCSYAGADTAGINRVQYSPHVRVIRMMCSGRIHPAFVLRAFEKGADGVLVTGCHIGDCHYISGNERAIESFEIVKSLTALLGIESDRIGLEWISAAEGQRFGQVMDEFVARVTRLGPMPRVALAPQEAVDDGFRDLARRWGAYLCYECGKCTGVCTVAQVREGFSPRRAVRAAATMRSGLQSAKDCLTCALCDAYCPQDVKISPIMAALRALEGDDDAWGDRPHGGIFQALGRLMARGDMNVNHAGWVPETAHVAEKSDTLLYVGCAPFHDAFFTPLDVHNLDAARGALRILNHLGIEPMVLSDERCCGHDFYWGGDWRTFRTLAELNRERVLASGAKRIVFTCPECLHTFRTLYAEAGVSIPATLVGITELLAANASRLGLEAQAGRVTFQDPCRLARYEHDVESPRAVLKAVPGLELSEMAHSGAHATCCAGGWSSCDARTKLIQMNRLAEARATGAETLVTACPKCEIHLKCALQHEPDYSLKIRDLTALVADALPGAELQVAPREAQEAGVS